jgi:catalase
MRAVKNKNPGGSKYTMSEGISREEIGDPVMLHDPIRVSDGLEVSDDPTLVERRGIYELLVARRTCGWKGRPAALERPGCLFGGGATGEEPRR